MPRSLTLLTLLVAFLSTGRETAAVIEGLQNPASGGLSEGASSSSDACPEWLTQYTKFHAENKHSPDAKYLVFLCSHTATADIKGIEQDSETHCSYGIGDRLRGMEFVLRLAYATNRIYLLQTQYPAPMREFLVPAAIDWEMGNLSMPADFRYFVQRLARTPETDPVANGAVAAAQDQWVAITTRQVLGTPLVNAPDVDVMGTSAQWMFHALFKPSPAVAKSMTDQLNRLDIDPGTPYVAMHMRLGGQLGEDNAVGRYEPMTVLRAALSCARQLRSAILGLPGCGAGDPPADPSLCAAAAGSGKRQRALLQAGGSGRTILSHAEEGEQGGGGGLVLSADGAETGSQAGQRSRPWAQQESHSHTGTHLSEDGGASELEKWKGWLLQRRGARPPAQQQQQQENGMQQGNSMQLEGSRAQRRRQLLLQRSKVQMDGKPEAGSTGAPIVLITDNLDMKRFVTDILGPYVVTTNVTPHHWGANQRRREQADLYQFVQTVGDMGVLAQSACLIISRGGFGYHAYLWGRHTCVALLDTCKHPDHPY